MILGGYAVLLNRFSAKFFSLTQFAAVCMSWFSFLGDFLRTLVCLLFSFSILYFGNEKKRAYCSLPRCVYVRDVCVMSRDTLRFWCAVMPSLFRIPSAFPVSMKNHCVRHCLVAHCSKHFGFVSRAYGQSCSFATFWQFSAHRYYKPFVSISFRPWNA